MKTRIIVGAVIAVALLALCFLCTPVIRLAVFALLAVVAVHEMYDALKVGGYRPFRIPAYLCAALLAPACYKGGDFAMLLLMVGAMAVFVDRVFSKTRTTKDMLASLVPYAYPLPFFAVICLALSNPDPIGSTVLISGIAYACITDVCAYFTGYFCGKHKLCPEISPKKTVEGAVGGFVCSVAIGAPAVYFLQFLWGGVCSIWFYLLCGLFCSIAGQIGDLAASIVKREMGIKDYGWVFPGHGGVMDRFDSILFSVPTAYIIYMLVFRLV